MEVLGWDVDWRAAMEIMSECVNAMRESVWLGGLGLSELDAQRPLLL